MSTFTKYCLITLCISCLTACGVLDYVVPKGVMEFVSPKGSKLSWDGFTVLAGTDANLNSAVAVDIVLARDDATLNLVSGLSAAKWFSTRNDIKKSFPQGLRYRSLELVPGQSVRLQGSEFEGLRVVGVLVFADYLTPGEHRARVDQVDGEVVAQLGARDFQMLVPVAR